MLGSKIKRLGELESRIAASHKQTAEKHLEAIWEQLSDAEHKAMWASLERREQPGYMLNEEDHALEQRWHEAVCAVVPKDRQLVLHWQAVSVSVVNTSRNW